MNRQTLIEIAEEVGLLFPDSVELGYNHPQHMRLISKLEKFAHSVSWHERNKEFLNSEES